MQSLLDALLWDIYGNITLQSFENTESCSSDSVKSKSHKKNHFKENTNSWKFSENMLEKQCEYIYYIYVYTISHTIETQFCFYLALISLRDTKASMKLEIRDIGSYLGKHLINRDKLLRKRQVLFNLITASLQAFSDKSRE